MQFRKVFIGMSDIASMINEYTVGFKALGLEVFSAVHTQAAVQSSKCDIVIDKYIQSEDPVERQFLSQKVLAAVFKKAVEECDIFLFMYHTFMHDFSDVAKLKSLGKKIIFHFVGSDSRWANAFNQDMHKYGLLPLTPGQDDNVRELPRTLLRLRTAEKYADVIFNTPSQSGLALRPYYNCLAYPLDSTVYGYPVPQRETPVVLHAPSNRLVKGSEYIEGIFKKLEYDGVRFIPKVIHGMSHAQALQAYHDVDMLAGQMGGVTGGRQERELMA